MVDTVQLVFSYGASIQYIHGAYLLETLVESAVVVLVIGVDVELVLLGRGKQGAARSSLSFSLSIFIQ